ncbi:hypothetical protein ACHAWC_009978 [Mediolabrus comicus]
MAASLTRLIRTLPVPLFGSLNTAAAFTIAKSKALPRMAGWAVPLAIGGLWFVWPAVDDGWKIEMGFKSDPEAAAAAAAAAQDSASASKESKITLSEEAMTKVENAYKASEHTDTDDDKLLSVAVQTGDYTALEEKWEAFNEKAIRPGEDDDEEEDEDDDDDDEEDEEEEDEEED